MNANDYEIGQKGTRLIAGYEGTVLHKYRDQVGIVTVCVGHVVRPEDAAWIDDGVTAEECDAALSKDLAWVRAAIRDYVHVDISQNMGDALSSLVYNIGTGNFRTSTLLSELNAGNYRSAADHFLDWKMAGGKPILLHRREGERALFLADDATPRVLGLEDAETLFRADLANALSVVDATSRDAVSEIIDPMRSTG